MDKYKVNIYTN